MVSGGEGRPRGPPVLADASGRSAGAGALERLREHAAPSPAE